MRPFGNVIFHFGYHLQGSVREIKREVVLFRLQKQETAGDQASDLLLTCMDAARFCARLQAQQVRQHFREEGEEVLEFLKPLKGWPRPPGLTK